MNFFRLSSLFYLALIFVIPEIQAQVKTVSGTIRDFDSGEPLSFGNIRVLGTTHGTSANKNGEYELKLAAGKYLLTASYIGYVSDTISLILDSDVDSKSFFLKQTSIVLPELTVLPGENPALAVIRKAIERKRLRNLFLRSFEFEAYTKGIIRTEEDFEADGNKIKFDTGISDSAELIISGIIENQSRGYYKKPDLYKEVILARKQTSNFPSFINVLTGGRLIQNFYEDDINFLSMDIPGPLSENALEYYDFFIERTIARNDNAIFIILLTPRRNSDPGFTGSIFIKDSTYDLVQVNLQINRAANRGGIFDSINVFQQFDEFVEGIYMPVDYRLFAEANVLNIARFGFELSTIMYDYKINPEISEAFFNRAVLTVLPDADSKDSLYWTHIQAIPETFEEVTAYERIDSLGKVPVSFWDEFSFLSPEIKITDNLFVSSPISMYHFNRVEGHTIDFSILAEDLADLRLNTEATFSYGLADKKVKSDFSGYYLLGKYRTTKIDFNAYNKLKIQFGTSDTYNELTSTLLALISKHEFRDYYYSRGFNINLSAEVLPILTVSAGFANYSDKSAVNNSDFSFFSKDEAYRINPPVNDVDMNEINAGFLLDFRNYIEDGYFRRRISGGKSYVTIAGDITHSADLWINTFGFTKYSLALSGDINSFRSTLISLKLYGSYNIGNLPFQNLYALPGNINLISQDFTFRTLNVNEMLGEKVVSLNIEYYLRDEIFKLLNMPFFRTSEILLKAFFNAAYILVDEESKSFLPVEVREFRRPFYEVGFGLGHVLFPVQAEFAWKLNYRGENNFRVGLNSFIF